MTKAVLHRASYMLPVQAPPICDGGVVVAGGRILAAGPFKDLKKQYAVPVQEHDGIITPGLVNAHAHLELSHLTEVCPDAGVVPNGITDWIRSLLQAREQDWPAGMISSQAQAALSRMQNQGVAVVADIGNLQASYSYGRESAVAVHFFLELIGLSKQAEEKLISFVDELPPDLAYAAHAAYSVSAELIKYLKQRASRSGKILPLHVAESTDEVRFLHDGGGKLAEFLAERQALDGTFTPPGLTPVAYLDQLGILDHRTLCVHAVQVTEADVALLARRRAKVCLCPTSNRTLGVGRAPLEQFLAQGLLPALGTDSLASNRALNIWEEMKLLREEHPSVSPETVFVMATRGGAEALGVEHDFGALMPGASSALLLINKPAAIGREVFEFLTTAGENIQMTWLK